MIMVGLVGGVSYHHHRRCLAWILEFAISHKYGLVRWLGASLELCPPCARPACLAGQDLPYSLASPYSSSSSLGKGPQKNAFFRALPKFPPPPTPLPTLSHQFVLVGPVFQEPKTLIIMTF